VKHGLIPLICVGETLAERESGQADAVLSAQGEGALQFLEGEAKGAKVLFAYEPVWAIDDKGIPASYDYADEQQALIKTVAGGLLPSIPPVLYGGSVNPGNAAELIGQPNITASSSAAPPGTRMAASTFSAALRRRSEIIQTRKGNHENSHRSRQRRQAAARCHRRTPCHQIRPDGQ
jgi:hypothetical protein